ncbi:MAG: hypothetical protein JOZ22_13430 [Acidobacteriia bacterium]|nr:hypothetical protein [Terriglobia bacterium]
MKLGTNEPKKVAALGVLVVVAGYLVYTNLFSGPSVSSPRTAPQPAPMDAPAPSSLPGPIGTLPARAPLSRGRSDELHPVLHPKRPEDRQDPSKIDPTLRLDLFAKLQEVPLPSAGRNPFKLGAPPAPKVAALNGPEPIVKLPPVASKPVPPPPPPGPPPPPPITLKYYGFSASPNASKTAFFLDGEDILVAKEGDTLKRRYKVVRIGTNSVTMEDTDSKRQQTIQLTEEAG